MLLNELKLPGNPSYPVWDLLQHQCELTACSVAQIGVSTNAGDLGRAGPWGAAPGVKTGFQPPSPAEQLFAVCLHVLQECN